MRVFEFDIFTFYYKVTNLLNYATYNVTVTGFTQAGNGPAPEYLASKSYTLLKLINCLRRTTIHSFGTHFIKTLVSILPRLLSLLD